MLGGKYLLFHMIYVPTKTDSLQFQSLEFILRGEEVYYSIFRLLQIYNLLPQTVKGLKLDPANELTLHFFLRTFTYTNMRVPITPMTSGQTMTHLSLVLDVITDVLICSIAHDMPLLVKLDLKDQPHEPSEDDLSDDGLPSLGGCRHLTILSLIRSQKRIAISFIRMTDMGMYLHSEGCKGLESVRFGGFSKVTGVGFSSIHV